MIRRVLVGFGVLAALGLAVWVWAPWAEEEVPAGVGDAADEGLPRRGVHLMGSPDEVRTISREALVARLDTGEADAEAARAELRRRAETDPGLVTWLLGLLDLDDEALRALGIERWQIPEALVAAGPAAARPVAQAWMSGTGTWTWVFVDVLGQLGTDAAPAVPVLLEGSRGWTPPMTNGLAHVLRAIGPAAGEAAPRLTAILEPPVDDDLASAAAFALLSVAGPTPEVLEVFRRALLDEETLSRPHLLSALGNVAGEGAAALAPLFVELLQDPEEQTAVQAAAALGRTGVTSRAVLLGLVYLLQDGTPAAQRSAAGALATLGDSGQATLVDVLTSAEDVDERLSAFQALLRTGTDARAHVDVLLRILDEDVDRDWKLRALALLAQVDPPPDVKVVLPALEYALTARRLEGGALLVLANLPGPEARARLRAYAGDGSDPERVAAVVQALQRSAREDSEAGNLLVDLLERCEDSSTRIQILTAFLHVRPPPSGARALPLLQRLQETAPPEVQVYLPRAIASVRGDERRALDLMLEGLASDEWQRMINYANALYPFEKQAPRVVPAVIACAVRWAEKGVSPAGLRFLLQRLGTGWAGTAKALDDAIAGASETARPLLESLR